MEEEVVLTGRLIFWPNEAETEVERWQMPIGSSVPISLTPTTAILTTRRSVWIWLPSHSHPSNPNAATHCCPGLQLSTSDSFQGSRLEIKSTFTVLLRARCCYPACCFHTVGSIQGTCKSGNSSAEHNTCVSMCCKKWSINEKVQYQINLVMSYEALSQKYWFQKKHWDVMSQMFTIPNQNIDLTSQNNEILMSTYESLSKKLAT